MLDATVFATDPVADTANVEMSDEEAAAQILRLQRERDLIEQRLERAIYDAARSAPRFGAAGVGVGNADDRDPSGMARWQAPGEPAPDTALALALPRYDLTHGAGATEMAIELRPPCTGAYVRLGRAYGSRDLPARVALRDGTHFIATMCPGVETTLVTELVVGPRAPR